MSTLYFSHCLSAQSLRPGSLDQLHLLRSLPHLPGGVIRQSSPFFFSSSVVFSHTWCRRICAFFVLAGGQDRLPPARGYRGPAAPQEPRYLLQRQPAPHSEKEPGHLQQHFCCGEARAGGGGHLSGGPPREVREMFCGQPHACHTNDLCAILCVTQLTACFLFFSFWRLCLCSVRAVS